MKLFLTALLFCYQLSAFAAQYATVSAEQAVIYADLDAKSSIGFIKKGRKVKVGDVKRNKGSMLPIIVSGKVAYIRIIDIQTGHEEAILETTSDRIKVQSEKKFTGRFEVGYTGYLSNYAVKNPIVGDETKDLLLNGFFLKGHVLRSKNVTYRMAATYLTGTVEDETIRIFNIDGDAGYNIIDSSYYDFKIFAGVSVIPYCQYEIEDMFQKNGYGAGAYAGLEMIFDFGKYLSIHVDGKFQYMRLTGVKIPEALETDWEPSFYGASLGAGLSYSY